MTKKAASGKSKGKREPKYPPLNAEMKKLVKDLREIVANPVVESAYNEAVAHVEPQVAELGPIQKNPWLGTTVDHFVNYFEEWFTFLPTPSGGLGRIVPLTFFYANNRQAYYFLNDLKSKKKGAKTYKKEIFNWTVEFVKARGRFMDSPESLWYVDEWKKALGPAWDEFIVPKKGYKSFNDFFTRELKNPAKSRPVFAPDDDSVVVASADSEINFIQSELTLETNLQVKTRQINVHDLLHGSKYAKRFVGGTAVSCVLMPNFYHRYHAPVGGHIVESREVPGIYNGILDGDHWFNQGNIGESTTEFSIFEDFHRSYFVLKYLVKQEPGKRHRYAYMAVIPVGLNTISAMFPSMVNNKSTLVPRGGKPVKVKKGDELGHFAYGGSLNILLFQAGVFGSVSVLMGQRLGTLSKPS